LCAVTYILGQEDFRFDITFFQTGTAHSILKTLPLLDYLHEDSPKLAFVAFYAYIASH
jgi:hypothetical protein